MIWQLVHGELKKGERVGNGSDGKVLKGWGWRRQRRTERDRDEDERRESGRKKSQGEKLSLQKLSY